MSKLRFTFNLLTAIAVTFVCVSFAQAQATRTWVSGTGDDVNPCSRTAPCKTFAGAISKTAAAGEIDALDSGGFGAVTIGKSLTIDGAGSIASILSSGTNGVTVNAASTDTIILRNISINGVGTGINGVNWVNAGGNLIVENVEIERVTGSGILMNLTNSGNLTVTNSRINLCGSVDHQDAAVRVTTTAGTARATIAGTSMSGNRVGVQVGEHGVVFVRDSVVLGNQSVGQSDGFGIVSTSSSFLFLENCTATHGGNGVRSVGNSGATPQTIYLSNCNIFNNNVAGVNVGPNSTALTYQTNRITGNALDVSGTFNNIVPGQR